MVTPSSDTIVQPSPLDTIWNEHDRTVIAQAERLAQADDALLDALMASHRTHSEPYRPGEPKEEPDPLWRAYLDRRRATLDNVFDAMEEMLALLPVPHAQRKTLTPYQVRRLRDADILDTMNLSTTVETFNARERRRRAEMGTERYSWFEFDRDDMIRRFGKPHSGFRNFDGLFGMWWFQVPVHPWIDSSQVFNVCAGPTGLRAGLLTSTNDPRTRPLWDARETLSLDNLLIAWFHSSIAAALDPARPWPWWRLQRWTFEVSPTLA